MAEVIITKIRNRTKETITIAHQQRGHVKIEPGSALNGPFLYHYDPEKEGPIPTPNEAWFVRSKTEFEWGTAAFSNPDAMLSDPEQEDLGSG